MGALRVLGQPELPPPASATTTAALVNMPFAMVDRPSIQCGLLKAAATRAGHEVDVHYLNLELAARLGAKSYRQLSLLRSDQLLGEWLFSAAAFGSGGDEAAYREACPGVEETCAKLGVEFDRLCELRNSFLPAWIAQCAEEVDWGRYRVVGFTSIFEQNAAALALARQIKQRHPDVVTVFGGANFDGGMGREFVRHLPFVDYAVVGEGDHVFPSLLATLAAGESALGMPGVLGGANGSLVDGGAAKPIHDLDALPDPDYGDYFATLERLGRHRVIPNDKEPVLLFESARGCWWGEKAHCTFCGLNNNGMAFRAKSPRAAQDVLRRLSSKYKTLDFEAVDNIMDYRYLQQLCEPLAEERLDYTLFYEVKANLRSAQLKTMVKAGIRRIQPGIESLSTHILSLMRKGVTMLDNLRLLKWAYYHGMRVEWNVLMGFPGETPEDYQRQVALMPSLWHLPPPAGAGRIWLERFSPYFFDTSFPVRNVRPLEAYRFIYPDGIDLASIAYFFRYDMGDTLPDEAYAEVRDAVQQWRAQWSRRPRPVMQYRRNPEWLEIDDRRGDTPRTHLLSGWQAAVYEMCGEGQRAPASLRRELARGPWDPVPSEAEIDEVASHWSELGLVAADDGKYLSLALPKYRYC